METKINGGKVILIITSANDCFASSLINPSLLPKIPKKSLMIIYNQNRSIIFELDNKRLILASNIVQIISLV
ncbi:hypothetical protein ES708_03127 [subsurface metagenome]